MKNLFVLSLLLSVFTSSVFAQVKPTITKSSVTFQIKNLGINTTGSISGLTADIQFDPAHLNSGSIIASVNANTVNTENETRDEHLKGESYFDVAHYPKITMKSISFKHKRGDNYTGRFDLSLKGITKIVELPFTYTQDAGNNATFKGELKLDRTEFNIGSNSLVMSKDVVVDITIEISNNITH